MSEIVNVVSRDTGKLDRKKVRASPYEFTIATRAKWEMVIANEDITIGAGKLERIKVKEIKVQKDMLAMPCAFSHHALVSVIKVGAKEGPAPVEIDRVIDTAYILGQESGEIKKGDLLSVLNLYPIMFTREATKPLQVG
ncbi:hypothetical protein ANME2D_02712 [Candidatus Methanoperedens nitroreducens]|uniref:DUF22 domain-containing protein n=1 Tax=Candidatus Methanoperedens nitratireducens TaxID=1392998 RepID=A0A062V4D3_9EURY|nr:DUF22 domain-containing protein [Candidatus Methanoperedens nitroreducens]KCZ70689.1 hypothetical protein ANME2D_02712 [Candidatus Methanoperedens nitroreducens]MDJ1420543.1 DUF22 domain-containing protein [Candidatus Methanoperedens sp.]